MAESNSEMTEVLLLGRQQDQVYIECFKMLRQLSVLWKFRLRLLEFTDLPDKEPLAQISHIVVAYGEEDQNYEEWCSTLISSHAKTKTLLVDGSPKSYRADFSELFSVEGTAVIAASRGKAVCHVVGEDIILKDVPRKLSIVRGASCIRGKIGLAGARSLLVKTLAGGEGTLLSVSGDRYCTTISLWQLGVPEFPAMLTILKNFLFDCCGTGYFSPSPVVAVRIDDYPLTSQQYLRQGRVSDGKILAELKILNAWARVSGARLEFMVCSKIMNRNGELLPVEELVPRSLAWMQREFTAGRINVNAHGRSHVDENRYQNDRTISPFEFSSLREVETIEHLQDNLAFIKAVFGKVSTGFVPPSWGYSPGVTKAVSSRFFSFVIDSYQQSKGDEECLPAGAVDDAGLLYLAETWHLGRRNIDHANPVLWHAFLDNGIPLHMMTHGPYIYDPLPAKGLPRVFVLLGAGLLLPFFLLTRPGIFWPMIRNTSPLVPRDRLGPFRLVMAYLPLLRNAALRNLLMTGKRFKLRWCYPEDLAKQLRGYSGLRVSSYNIGDTAHRIVFDIAGPISEPLEFHLPTDFFRATLDKKEAPIKGRKVCLEPSSLVKGRHVLVVERRRAGSDDNR